MKLSLRQNDGFLTKSMVSPKMQSCIALCGSKTKIVDIKIVEMQSMPGRNWHMSVNSHVHPSFHKQLLLFI